MNVEHQMPALHRLRPRRQRTQRDRDRRLPSCRGVWLDRGELDKLIERSLQWRSSSRHDDDDDDDRHERHGRRDRDDDHWKHRQKAVVAQRSVRLMPRPITLTTTPERRGTTC